MKHEIHPIHRAAALLSRPVHVLGHAIARVCPHHRVKKVLGHKAGQIGLGTIFILIGSGLAEIHQGIFPSFVWHGIAYTIHGLGAAPLVEHVLKFFIVAEREASEEIRDEIREIKANARSAAEARTEAALLS